MEKFTKIVATISDKRCDTDFIRTLSEAGINVVRMNSAHLEYEGFKNIVEHTREADKSLGIIMDTKGPEIRTTVTVTGEPVEYHTGDLVKVIGNPDGKTSDKVIYLNYSGIGKLIKSGDRILIDDGEMAFSVISNDGEEITAKAENDGKLGSRKSVNLPGVKIDLPAVTERDARNIGYAVELGVDFIAHSFVRSAADVKAVQDILDSYGAETKIISKIENQEGIDNFDEILEASYGIMVARGDLGIEVPAEKIPGIQAMMIRKCIAAHKPVIVATQMLHTMIEHPRPTRAEISDVANAVYQRADAMMLSGETANGKYPVEAVRTMTTVAKEVEKAQRSGRFEEPSLPDGVVTSFLSYAAVRSEKEIGTKAIFTDAFHGTSARYISSFRGNNPTYAICHNRNVQRWLSLSYGVKGYFFEGKKNLSRHSAEAVRSIVDDDHLQPDDLVAYLTGIPGHARALEILTPNDIFEES